MQIVIDIDDEVYKKFIDDYVGCPDIIFAVRRGTPLPKGHGRLIDIDAAYHTLRQYISFDDLDEVMSNLNCVLEADKEEQDEADND